MADRGVAYAHQHTWRGNVALIAKPGGANTGVGRYVQMLQAGLQQAGVPTTRIAPSLPPIPQAVYGLLRRCRVDMRAFWSNYPLWAQYPQAAVYHLTSQNLATLLLVRRPTHGKIMVTVHDIIPYMMRNDPQLSSYRTVADRVFDRMAMVGLKRADHLLADSQYTKECVVHHLGIASEKIHVVHLGIDHLQFRPLPVSPEVYERYNLQQGTRYLIYVGSEDPRKNVRTLIQAFAKVRQQHPDVALIKVGRAHFIQERQRLLALATELGVRADVHFLDDVPENDLPLLYNLAEICVMPSLYEGFGFPVLEAQACGTPVICADAASLPELAGDAGILFQPHGAEAAQALSAAIVRVLNNHDLAQTLRAKGLDRSSSFRWQHTIERVLSIYQAEQFC